VHAQQQPLQEYTPPATESARIPVRSHTVPTCCTTACDCWLSGLLCNTVPTQGALTPPPAATPTAVKQAGELQTATELLLGGIYLVDKAACPGTADVCAWARIK
jgi:hypothetical protein